MSNNWEYINGRNQSAQTVSNYTVPFPGSMYHHTMVLDSADRYLYIFGGLGNGYINAGIF